MGNTSKSKYASQWEEVRKKKKAEEEEEESNSAITTNSSKTSNKYESQWAEVKRQNIVNTLNTMLEDYNNSVSSAQDRFKNVNSYRGDTADYLSQVEGYRNAYTTKKSEIDALLKQYKGYYDDDFIKAVNSTYADLDSGYEGLYKNASADHEYFSQFADENAYKGAQDNQTYSKKYAKSTYADLQKAKAEIEERLRTDRRASSDALNRELYWLQNHDRDIQYVDSMSDDDLSNLQADYDSNKKTLEAEKAKLQKEITEIKNKAGRASPESWSGYKEKVARIQEIDEILAQESPVLYYDDVGAVTVNDTLRDREHEVTFNAIEGNADHQAAYDNALEAKANIEELDVKSRDLQEQIRRYETEGHVPDALISELNSVESAIAKNRKVIEDFNSLGYDFNELEHYNRTKESRANYIAEQKKDAEYAREHYVDATLKSILTAPASIGELVGNLIDTAQYGYSNVYDDKYTRQNQAYQSTVADMIDEKTYNAVLGATNNETIANAASWLASGAYSGVTSSAQSFLTGTACTLMFGPSGATVALAIMGTEAAASSYNNAIMNGSTNGEAILTATASGIAEALFEKVSLDKLLDIGKMYDVSSMSALLKSMIKNSGAAFVQGGVEASEEFFTEITNKLADEIINGDHSAYNTAIAKYKKMGYSDADAKEIATKDAINDVLSALYGGFIGGMGSGAGASLTQGTRATGMAIGNEILSNQYYNQMGKNVVTNEGVQDLVGKANGSSSLRKLANKVAGVDTTELTDEKGVKKYEKQVGKLYKGVTESQLKELSKTNASETEVNSFTELVKEELKSKGVDNVDKVAEVIVKSALNDGKLTREESIIYNSANGRQVIHNVLRSEDLKVDEGSSLEQVKNEINSTRELGKFDAANAIKRDLLDKTDYKISSDGVTTIEATDEAVDSMRITSLDGDDITLEVKVGDNHHTVVAGEMSLNQDYAVIFEGLKNIKNKFGLDESTANQILTLWEGHEGDSFKFSKAIEEGFMYGQYNMRTEFENSAFAEELSEETRNLVFELGREYKQKVTDEKNASAQKEAKADIESKVTFAEGVSYNNLNESQKAQVDMAQVIAHTFGFNLEVFRSPKNALGRSIGENGSYSASTNTMRLDIDAGTLDGKSLILFTQAHELTHYIKKWSPEKYKVFADFLVEKYAEKDVPLKKLIQQKINESKIATEADKTGRHHVLTFDEAFDEVVCNACEDFLADPDIQQTILEISKVDQGIAQKIKDFIKNLINRLDKALRGLQGESLEAEFVRGLDAEDIQQLKDLWLVALIDSRENVVQARKRTTAEDTTDTANEDDLQFMARYAKQGGNFSSALDSAEWSKYNYAMISGVDAGLRISDHSILVECEKGEFTYKLVVYDNKTEENRILAVYGIGKNLYNEDISNFGAKTIGEFITNLEEQRYDNKKVLKRILDPYSRNVGYVLGRYNSKSNRFNKYGQKVSENESSNRQKTNGRGVSQGVGQTQINSDIQFHDRDADVYSRISEMQLEVNKLRQSIADIESSDEFKEEQRKLSEAFSNDIDTAIELYTKWLEDSEYGKLKSKKDAMEEELNKLRTEYSNQVRTKALEEEKNAIAKSGLSEADYFRKQAIKEFGYTPYFYDAGYITPNGKMLNFSGEKGKHFGSRGEDHRAIGIIYAETQGTDALNRFMKDGNIRIMAESPGLDISTLVEPTKEQYSTIRKFVSEYTKREYFNVDLSDESGKVIGSLEYEGRINPTRVINDIKHYYATGEIREQSSVERFLFQDRDSTGRELSPEQAEFFKDSKVRDADGRLNVMYHGSPETFTVFDKKKSRSSGTYGNGFYFTDSRSHAGTYGDSYEVYLNITNPIQNGTNDITKDQLRKFVEAIAEDEDYGIENYGYGATIDSVTDSVYGKSDFGMLMDLNISCVGNMVQAIELFNKVNGTDYNGIVAPTETVAFYSNQIKAIDNLNPTENEDIRFQDRVYNGSLTQERIDYLIKDSGAKFNIGYANTWIASINPSDFIDLTLRYETRNKGREVFDTKVEGDYGGVMGDRDYISDLKNSREIPYLCVDMDTGKVIGHNGRHRMRALEKTGATRTPIGIKFYKNDDLYKGNYDGVRLETIDAMRLTSQFDDEFYSQYNAYIHDIIPLNEDHRDEIEKAYRAKPMDVKYGFTVAYQDRPYQPSLEDLGIDFKEENERLKADVERLEEMLKLQGTVTHGKALATKAYEGVAKKLLHEFGMKRVTDKEVLDTFVKKLDKFYYSIIDADELAWEKIFNDAQEIAEWVDSKIVEKPKRIDYADEILKEIRSIKISLDDAQMQEVAYAYGSYNAFRKSSFGRINLSNDGIKLDSQWSEWANAYPFVFDADTNSADMPIRLVEIINDLKTAYEVTEEYSKKDQIRDMATSIYDSYWDIPTVRTLADKHQKEVNLLKSKHKAEMDALKEKKDAKLKDTKAYYQEMVKKVRADKDAKMEAYKERTQKQIKKNLEGRTKTATKNKIKRVVKTLESLYNNPTKEKNVKIDFQDMVNKALIMADAIFDNGNISAYDVLSGKITISLGTNEKKKLEEWRKIQEARQGYQNRLDALESSSSKDINPNTYDELLKMISKCNSKLNVLGRELSDVVERQKAELNNNSVQNAIDSLVEAYKSLDESTESYVKAAYNDYVATRLETLKESLKGTTAKTMSLTQLDELYQAYKMVLTSVRTANELFVKNKRLSVVDAGESVIREVQKVAKITENKIGMLNELRGFSWQELKPVYAFERIGSQTFMDMYKEVLRGQGIFARDIEDSKDFFNDKGKAYGYDSWDTETRKDFKLADGRIFSLSLQEIMSIYAYSKREQALDHITDGGFVFDTKEFFTDNREKGLKGKIKKQRTTVKAYRLNIGEFQQIINSLTKEQKKFVDDMQDYLSSVMGAKGNEVSRVLYGIDLFKEKYYFPLMSSHDFITQTNNPAGEVALKNTGMAKATVPHARNPIILKGFMDVWSEHVNKMSTYHSFVLPIENLNKVFNYTGYASSDDSISVETILRGAYGESVNDYIKTFIQDLNGGVKVQGSGNFVMKAINKFKKTAVAASTSVVIQQPTAIVRALAMIDAKYFVHKADGMKHKDAWEELKKYAPIAIVKEMGGFDVGGGKMVAEYITAKEYKGIKAKAKGWRTDSTYRDESLMWGASKADEFGWITIWSAVKKEIADTTTLKVGSEEFLQACGERFTEVIDYTQVYDSVISRSGFMRNKGEISKMATSFMGEPTTSFNMLYNAVLQAKRGNISKGEMAKIMGATISSIILASIAKSLIYALRDDDDDESYVEKYFQSLTNSLMEDLFIPNMLPYVNDIISLFSGWDVERTDMAILKDFKDAIDGLDSSDKSLWRKIEDLAGAVAAFGGIPLKNVIRTGREMYNLMANLFDDNTASADDVGDAIVETITGETSASDINEALEKGNTTKAKKIIKDLVDEKVEQGKTEKEAKASIKASVTGYWKELYLQAYRDNNSAEMLRIRQILQSTGLYDNVIETCQSWIKGMKDETTTDTKYKKW